jgi:hypothetical protein
MLDHMDWLLNLPPLAKLGVVFALMLVLIRARLNVGWALCAGAVACGLWFRQGPVDILRSIGAAATDPAFAILVSLIMLVLILNHTLKESGQIERIVNSFLAIARRPRTTLIFFPALLGLLPMPGGALFSAPMVETAGRMLHVDEKDKTLINYWFRHVWEYSWPLYPGIMLSAVYSGYSVLTICLVQSPLMVFVIIEGWFFYARHLKARPTEQGDVQPAAPGGRRRAAVGFLRQAAPIWLVIVVFAVLRTLLAAGVRWAGPDAPVSRLLSDLPKNLDLLVAVVLVILYTWARNRMGLKAIRRVFWQRDMLDNLVIALGIIVFGGVLAGSGAAHAVAGQLHDLAIPTWVVAIALPFTVGAITGITMNMVVLTYQIILFMVHNEANDHLTLAYCTLAFASGYAGILITPVHICMVQSNHYFKLNATATLRRLALPVLGLILAGLVLFQTYRVVLPWVGRGPGTHEIPATSVEAAVEAVRRAADHLDRR